MDVANRIAHWKEQSPEQWLKATNSFLPLVVTAVLVLAIAYRMAEFTWIVLPGADPSSPPPEVAISGPSASNAAPQPSLDQLANSHLFGEAPSEVAAVIIEQPLDAPDTTLNIKLTGIVAREADDIGQAIIANSSNEQAVYSVGDTIEGASGAILHTVYSDRVLLNRGGRIETLRLPEELAGGAIPQRAASPTLPLLGNTGSGSLREVISANATRITDIIRLSPHMEGGQMIGFRLQPGRDRDAFTALGLEPGDVVTDINGTVVNDPARGLQVFEALGETTMANVTIVRNGAPQVVVIDTSQLESLAENRQ